MAEWVEPIKPRAQAPKWLISRTLFCAWSEAKASLPQGNEDRSGHTGTQRVFWPQNHSDRDCGGKCIHHMSTTSHISLTCSGQGWMLKKVAPRAERKEVEDP